MSGGEKGARRPAPREDACEPGCTPRGVQPRGPVPPCLMPDRPWPPAQSPLRRPRARALPCPVASTARPARVRGEGSPLTAEGAAAPPELPPRPQQPHGHRLRPAAQACGPQPLQASLPGVASLVPVCGSARQWGLCTYVPGKCPRQTKQEGPGAAPTFLLKSAIISKNIQCFKKKTKQNTEAEKARCKVGS